MSMRPSSVDVPVVDVSVTLDKVAKALVEAVQGKKVAEAVTPLAAAAVVAGDSKTGKCGTLLV